jgi:hypothetical protein
MLAVDGVGESSLLGDPDSKFFSVKTWGRQEEEKEHTTKKRDGIQTAEPNRRD